MNPHDHILFALPWLNHKTLNFTLFTLFGLIGNILFSSRVLIQWHASEKAGKTVVPFSFWWLSIAAALVYIVYSYIDHELPFMLGFIVTLVPYVRNLMIAYRPNRPPRPRAIIISTAIVLFIASVVILTQQQHFNRWFFFSLLGNAIFGSRFFVQWVQSETRRESVMTLEFWYLSLIGSTILLAYSLTQGKIVFILAFIFNVIPYARNIILIHRHRKSSEAPSAMAAGERPTTK